MARVYTNTACRLHGSEYCAMLNMENCDSCTVCSETEERADAVRADLDIILANMPEESVSALFAGENCLLCKGEPQKKAWYALTDLGHAQPRRKKAGILGIAREPRAGSVLPVQIACCADCRKRYLALEYVQPLIGTAGAAAALVILSIRRFREPIAAVAEILPVLIFLGVTVLAILAGRLVKSCLARKYGALTRLNVMKAPFLADMANRGWFELNPNKGMSRLVFSKTPTRKGLFTAFPEQSEEIFAANGKNADTVEQNSETV